MLASIRPISSDSDDAQRDRLSNAVYKQLKEAILHQERCPTMLLQEAELSQRFNVSRTPVREALRHLLNEGLVTRNGRFYEITIMSNPDIRHLYELRTALERASVRLCAERASTASLDKLQDMVDAQAKAAAQQDTREFVSLDTAFHLEIARLTENTFLYEQLVSVHDKVMLVRAQEPLALTWFDGTLAEHERILNGLQRRDPNVADAEMHYHLDSVVRKHLD